MDTSDPRPSPEGPGPREDDGLWMETPRGETKAVPRAHAALARYYSVMDDEGVDDVFTTPPPPPPPPLQSSTARVPPAEGSAGGTFSKSSVTLCKGASDASEAEANPAGLGWRRGERRSMAAQDEAAASTAQTGSVDPSTDRDHVHMEGAGRDPSGSQEVLIWREPADEEGDQIIPEDIRATEDVGRDGVRQTGPTSPGVGVKDGEAESGGPLELSARNRNQTTPAEATGDDHRGRVDATSLNYDLTKSQWVKRESGAGETPQIPAPEDPEAGERGDGGRRIATDIEQGEQLLQRLQLVQRRQDVHVTETRETTGEDEGASEREGGGGHPVTDEGANESPGEGDERAKVSSSAMPEPPGDRRSDGPEARNSDDEDGSDSWGAPADSSGINPPETPETPGPSARLRLSATDTSIERQIQEAVQGTQNLQRAGGVFNLADNPDVLEIPFKTNVSLEPLPLNVGPIRQELRIEAVPGVRSEVEVHHPQETRPLLEDFQQGNAGGPTRHRKLPVVHPSALERTRSLEAFSPESCPVPRAYSLRLYEPAAAEGEKSPEHLRSRSPTGGPREKTRLSPYPKQDKQPRLCRSMDAISCDGAASGSDARGKAREGGAGRGSPILKQNPFFKLRPALALQPEVEKDIREAREREEELRRQRCTLYGEDRPSSQDEDGSRFTEMLVPDVRQQSRGKLERVWPPPSKRDQLKSDQQEHRAQRAGGHKAPLWQRWESGLINGQPSQQSN